MTWSLNAAGHSPAPEGANDWAEVEQELHDELAAVLSKPKYGTSQSRFGGNHVSNESLHTYRPAEPDTGDAGEADAVGE